MQVEASGEDVPPRVEFWNEYSVPEINVLIVGFDGLHGAHDQDACLPGVTFLNAITASAACPSPTYAIVQWAFAAAEVIFAA
jgi:hypothetical protein